MGKRQSSGKVIERRQAQVDAAVPQPVRSRRRLWLLLGSLLLLLAGVWKFGGLAAFPRMMADKSLALRDFAGAWRWTEVAGWLSYHDPANALLTARVARCQGDADRMEEALASAKHWGADPRALRREQLLALAQSGQLDDIESELVQLLAEAGKDGAEISDAYSNGLAMIARFDDALTVLDAWRRDFPDDPRPEHRIGRIQEHQQLYTEAEASYRRAVARDAGYFSARYSLGRVLLHQRRAEEAVVQFRACLSMPHPEAAAVELAVAHKAQGQADEARPLLRQVLAAPPAQLEASYRAVEEQPEGFKAAAEYGKLEADAGNFAEAEPWLVAALKANPQDLMSRYSLAVTLRGLGKKQEADEQFAKVGAAREAMGAAGSLNARIKRDPQDLEARCLLGKLILTHESERTGLYWIRSVLSYDPEYGPAHEILADYYGARSRQEPSFAGLAAYHRSKTQSKPKHGPTP
jgi:tetratricopeptide (TPR) repeat protein